MELHAQTHILLTMNDFRNMCLPENHLMYDNMDPSTTELDKRAKKIIRIVKKSQHNGTEIY